MVTRLFFIMIVALGALSINVGCLSVKTEHAVKPIHITMDINLKIDKELDDYFDDVYGDESTEASSTAK